MPGAEFFEKLGLYVFRDFLSRGSCAQLRSEMLEAASSKGTIFTATCEIVDETLRKGLRSHVSKSAERMFESRLAQLKPEIEKHFQTSLTGFEGPNFLRYRTGDFLKVHLDVEHNSLPQILKRRVSVIVFLNTPAENSRAREGYRGGALTFYGLMRGPEWEKCGFSLDASCGMLIAFRPDIPHEVSPITFGERFTISGWYTGEPILESSGAGNRAAQSKGRAPVRKRDGAAKTNRRATVSHADYLIETADLKRN